MRNSIVARNGAKVIPLYAYAQKEVSEVHEQIRLINEEITPLFEKFNSLFRIIEKAYLNADEQENFSRHYLKNLHSAFNTLSLLMPRHLKENKELFSLALQELPDNVVNEIFNTVCENSNIVLDEVFLS